MKILIGRDDLTAAAIAGVQAASPGLEVESLTIRPVHNASKPFVNESAIDVCEVAIVTMLQAICYGKPVGLLPLTSLGRFQHQTLVTCKDLSVDQIVGKTVGVRSWSQTTCVWVRGFLTSEHGVDLHSVNWVAYEDGHIAEYTDPAWVRRAGEGENLVQDFLDGRVDYAILGNDLPKDAPSHTAIPDADRAAKQWSERTGFAPINHVIGFSVPAARAHAAEICAIYDALIEVLGSRNGSDAIVMEPVGFAGLRDAFTQAADFAFEQEVLPRRVDFDEVVSATCEALGVPPSRLGG